jgi:hypothetical protein
MTGPIKINAAWIGVEWVHCKKEKENFEKRVREWEVPPG